MVDDDVRSLESVYLMCLSQILGISWYDHITNKEVLQRTGHDTLSFPIHTTFWANAPWCSSVSRWRITQPTSWSLMASPPRSSPYQVVESVSGHSLHHTLRSGEEWCLPWSPWWSNAMAYDGYVTDDDDEMEQDRNIWIMKVIGNRLTVQVYP